MGTKNVGQKSQPIAKKPSPEELAFMNEVAVPYLNKVSDDAILEKLADAFWDLCLWENDRAKTLDTKASYLLGLSGIAGAVVALGGGGEAPAGALLGWQCASLILFAVTAAASVFALLGRGYGSFNDEDVFSSVCANAEPVGEIVAFSDKNQKSCFLRETILQRWLIYRWHGQVNDSKYKRVVFAQVSALVSIVSLLGYIGVFVFDC